MDNPMIAQKSEALEQRFYGGDAGVFTPMRTALSARKSREELRGLLILSDAALIDRLVQCGITGSTAAALTLVPVIEVAWADGKIQKEERAAVMGGGGECGIVEPECKELLEHWLNQKPQPALFAAWRELAGALASQLASGEVDGLSQELVELARTIAKTAGGIMGIGRVSGAETKVLTAIAAAFGR